MPSSSNISGRGYEGKFLDHFEHGGGSWDVAASESIGDT